MLIKLNILCALICLLVGGVQAQNNPDSLGADNLFKIAREKVFNDELEEGREILFQILKRQPDYNDVRIFLARTYAWEKEFGLARLELEIVLAHTPDHVDAIKALVDVYMWDDQYEQALVTVNKALGYYPDAPDFLFKKASALSKLNRSDDALAVIRALLVLQPEHEQGILLADAIERAGMKYTGSIWYGLDVFSRAYAPAQYIALQLARTNAWGSSVFRVNYASRFSSQGLQYEVDLYPKVAKGVYAYLNYGYSTSSLFSRHRMGAEIYSKLPRSLEVSAGVRYLYFGPAIKVVIFTGSLGWYYKNYWVSYRPYVTADKSRNSFSSTFLIRRYFSQTDNYVGLTGGFGFSPDDRRIQSGAGLTSDGIHILKSQTIGITWQQLLPRNFIISVSYSLVRQELSSDLGKYAWINSSLVGVKKKF